MYASTLRKKGIRLGKRHRRSGLKKKKKKASRCVWWADHRRFLQGDMARRKGRYRRKLIYEHFRTGETAMVDLGEVAKRGNQ